MVDTYIFKRFKSVFDFDIIRGLKIIELCQYSIVFFIISVIFSKILNTYVFTYDDEKIKEMSLYKTILYLFFDLCIVTIAFFYIRKIALLAPSLSSYLHKGFKGHTTLEYTVHVALVYVFLELIKGLKEKLERVKELL